MKHLNSFAIGVALVAAGCGGEQASPGPLGDADALLVLQRPARNDAGDIFQYTSYVPGARLVMLTPPTADGTQVTLFPTAQHAAEYRDVDISGYDLSFDAKQIVFSARTADTDHYGLYILTLADGAVDALPVDPGRDYISPIWLPGDKILFMTNSVVEAGARQHQDEYERGTTSQIGRINKDGTGEELGPRNLSHRSFPALASDGRVIMTQWDHLGDVNAGHLMFINPDMTDLREAFGKEGTGASNSTLKPQEISPGRFIAIATSRDRTIQSGALIDIRLGTVTTGDGGVVSAAERMSEARATYRLLTPDVPLDNAPSADTIGRYYDAFPLDAKDKPTLVVSWADGPVESSVLAAAGIPANFGVFLFDSATGQRRPILDDPTMWDIFPRPLKTRSAPPIVGSATDPTLDGAALIGALNVYDSTLAQFEPGQVFGVRVSEGFSSEEGFPRMFGTTEFEGQAQLGIAPVASDGSWVAKIPANVPVHLQAIDKFGMSIQNEPVWFSARANESRLCGGCHEDRAATTNVQPGQLEAFAIGPTDMFSATPREARLSTQPFTRDTIVGVPWAPTAGSSVPVGRTLQNLFNTKCVSCHGPDNVAGIPGYTISDPVTGESVTWTFDLSDRLVQMNIGGADLGEWPASYISMAGPDMEAIDEGDLVISGNFQVYLNPQDARGSLAIQKLNPPVQFPTQNLGTRAFATTPHMADVGGQELTADEFYALILAADLGVNFYARENNPGLNPN